MARELKVVLNTNTGELNVRGIPDACARNEVVIAARWQDGGVVRNQTEINMAENCSSYEGAIELLLDEHPGSLVDLQENLREFIALNWDSDVAEKAVPECKKAFGKMDCFVQSYDGRTRMAAINMNKETVRERIRSLGWIPR